MINLKEFRDACPTNKNLRLHFNTGQRLDGRIVALGEFSAPNSSPQPSNVAHFRSVTGEEYRIDGMEIASAEQIEKNPLEERKYYRVYYDIFKGKGAVNEDQYYYFFTEDDLMIEQVESSLQFLLSKKYPARDNFSLELINITQLSSDQYASEKKGG